MKKRNMLLVLSVILLFAFTACSDKTPAPADTEENIDIGNWSVAIEGVDGVTAFTSENAATLTSKTVDMTITNSAGESKDESFTGVSLPEILTFLGISDFTSLTVEAGDGFAGEYGSTLALDPDTVLAWAKDGENFKLDQPVRMCPKNGTGNQFIKNTVKIIVIP